MARKPARKPTRKNTTKRSSKVTPISLKEEVILLLLMAFSILLFISNFGFGGIIGQGVKSFCSLFFGGMVYIFPILLFIIPIFFVSNKKNKFAWLKGFAGILLFLCFCIFLELITNKNMDVVKLTQFSTWKSLDTSGGGMIGVILVQILVPLFGYAGSYVFDIVMMIISLVIITEQSFFQKVKNGGEKIYETGKENNQRRKERRNYREMELEIEKGPEIHQQMAKKKEKSSFINLGEKKSESEIELENGNVVEITPSTEVKPSVKKTAKTKAEADILFEEIEFNPDEYEDVSFTIPTEVDKSIFEMAPLEEVSSDIPVIMENKGAKSSGDFFEYGTATEERNHYKEPSSEKVKEDKKAVETLSEKESHDKSFESENQNSSYQFPPIELLKKVVVKQSQNSEMELKETAIKLQQTLETFGVKVTITNVSKGPSVTRYELQPELGVKVSKIVALTDDIKLNLAAADIRMEAPIPGKAAIGIEVPNKENVPVSFRDLIESTEFKGSSSKLSFAVGKDISGQVVITDIAKMPHLLIAGATGSGKSVCINTLIMSILYKAHPDEVKLIMIDPKVVELSVYNGIPHLFIPVVTDPKKAAGALNWAVTEMTERYKKFAELNVRDLAGYNKKVVELNDIEPDGFEKLPQIVIIVDELADLMMVAPGDVEDAICRLAQLARAAGIHLILATQRPSVNVITGLIKANMPSRIAFAVSQGVDSRTILDMNGAEKLLGKGDMLFYPQGMPKPQRVQGSFVSDKEVHEIVGFLKNQNEPVAYNSEVENKVSQISDSSDSGNGFQEEKDTYFIEAGKLIIEKDKASIGMLQRVFRIGFNRAARLMDQLCAAGVVGEEEGTKPRKVLMSIEEFELFIDEYY